MKSKRFRQQIILTSYPVTGLFQYKDCFQILPADRILPSGDPIPWIVSEMISHKPAILEYSFDTPETEYFPDKMNVSGSEDPNAPRDVEIPESFTYEKKFDEIIRILSVLTYFDFYDSRVTHISVLTALIVEYSDKSRRQLS